MWHKRIRTKNKHNFRKKYFSQWGPSIGGSVWDEPFTVIDHARFC